jgi:hypothetical protein
LILRVGIDPSNPIISNRFSTFAKLSVRHNTRGTGVFGAAKGYPRTNRNNLVEKKVASSPKISS